MRAGQRPGAPGDRRRAGRPAGRWSGRTCTCCRPSRTPPRWVRNGWSTTTRRCGSGRCATPPRPGMSDTRVWCRVVGEELVIVAMTGAGTAEIARHGCPRRATRASSTRTTRTIPAATIPAHRGHGRAPRPRPTSWTSATAPTPWLVEAAADRRAAGAGEDGPRGRVRRHPRRRQGRPGPGPGRGGGPVRRARPRLDPGPPRHRTATPATWSAPTRPTRPSPAPARGRQASAA